MNEDMETWKIKYFSDKNMMKIFQSIMDSSKSANQISFECNIPIATVYRKLKRLQEKRLIRISGIINNDGVRFRKYRQNKNPNLLEQY